MMYRALSWCPKDMGTTQQLLSTVKGHMTLLRAEIRGGSSRLQDKDTIINSWLESVLGK